MANNNYSGAHLIIAFLAGAAAGAAVALLTAPQAGSETRDTVRGWARDAHGRVEKIPMAVREAYGRATTAARDAFVEALEQGGEESTAEKA
jgi:gas vesicle protein